MPISATREERVPGFHENAEMRFETVIDSPFAISASRRAANALPATQSISSDVITPVDTDSRKSIPKFITGWESERRVIIYL